MQILEEFTLITECDFWAFYRSSNITLPFFLWMYTVHCGGTGGGSLLWVTGKYTHVPQCRFQVWSGERNSSRSALYLWKPARFTHKEAKACFLKRNSSFSETCCSVPFMVESAAVTMDTVKAFSVILLVVMPLCPATVKVTVNLCLQCDCSASSILWKLMSGMWMGLPILFI